LAGDVRGSLPRTAEVPVSSPFPAPLPFRVTAASIDGATYLTVRGELDLHTAPELEQALAEEAAKGGTLILDMEGVSFIDSTGIRVLLLSWQESQRDGFDLRLTRGSDTVMRALELVGLVDELPFLGRSTASRAY
jgi:anti-anti-sigma factor